MSFDNESIVRTQAELCSLVGIPGREAQVAAYITRRLDGSAPVQKDPLGNLLFTLTGSDSAAPTILLDAHMDEIGFMVNHVDPQGFLRITPLGAIDRALMPGSMLVFASESGQMVQGIVGNLPPHVTLPEDRGQAPDFSRLFVDVGAADAEQVAELGLGVGSQGTFETPFGVRDDQVLIGRGFDNRTACNILLHLIEAQATQRPPVSVIGLFSVQEEVGGRGATTAAFATQPDLAIAIENTTATDVPGVPEQAVVSRLGGGPALTIADRTLIVPTKVLERLKTAADRAEVPYQIKRPVFGGTDGGRIALAGRGIPTGVVSVPCRYIHGPAALLRIRDITDTLELLQEFCQMDWSDWER